MMQPMRLLAMLTLLAACSTVTTSESFDATRSAVVIMRFDEGSKRAIDDELTETLVIELDLAALADATLPIDLALDGTASLDVETDAWSFESGAGHSEIVPTVTYDRSCFCAWISTDRSTSVRGELRITALTDDHVKGRVAVEGELSSGGAGPVTWSMARRFDVAR